MGAEENVMVDVRGLNGSHHCLISFRLTVARKVVGTSVLVITTLARFLSRTVTARQEKARVRLWSLE